MKYRSLALALLLVLTNQALAKDNKKAKGLLPDLVLDSDNERENDKKALKSEVLITKTEEKAIEALQKLIKKQKGTEQEPDLLNRLAELYMRRSKSGRFFDLHRDEKDIMRLAPPVAQSQTAKRYIGTAIATYNEIQARYPHYYDMPSVLFNNGFANQQIGQARRAEELYKSLVTRYPESPLVLDTHLALGEMKYDQGEFEQALSHFAEVEKKKESRFYSYALYKSGWTLYNMRKNEEAINKLIAVVKYHSDENNEMRTVNVKSNLRTEALRDLGLFFSEVYSADKAYSFFAKLAKDEELGDLMIQMAKLYDSHSRQKEMNVFLKDFIEDDANNPHAVEARLMLVEANETLRQRDVAIHYLEDLNKVCEPGSSWRRKNVTDTANEFCGAKLNQTNLEMARKWWDLWLKNKKQHNDLADYTTKAFELYLKREDPKKPDTKSRYAYAELLFQRERYKEASQQYEIVGNQSAEQMANEPKSKTASIVTAESKTQHDADYAALVSLQKAGEKNKSDLNDKEFRRLALKYLERNPNGQYKQQVQFQIGFVAYEKSDLNEAEKWLRPISEKGSKDEFQTKAQDILLDILNLRKDYKGLQDLVAIVLKSPLDGKRKEAMQKISREARFNEITEVAKTEDKLKAAQLFKDFSNSNKDTDLAQKALWQSLSIYFANKKLAEGADTALQYQALYPKDEKSKDVLEEASQSYAEIGQIVKAARTLEKLSAIETSTKKLEFLELAGDFYFLEGMNADAERVLKDLLTKVPEKNMGKIMYKLIKLAKGKEDTPEYQKLEQKILDLGIEPFAGELQLKKLQKVYASGDMSKSFDHAKKLMNNNSAPDYVRAGARLIQAQILEKEMISQSVKTSKIDRIAIVLSMKTEKLDKAQTAYISAMKMTENPEVRLKALYGLDRIYRNYVESINKIQLSAEMTPEEQAALKKELLALTQPITDKLFENADKIKSVNEQNRLLTTSQVADINFADLQPDATVLPTVTNLTYKDLAYYAPSDTQKVEGVAMDDVRGNICSEVKDKTLPMQSFINMANVCMKTKGWARLNALGLEILERDSSNPWGAYFLSLAAEHMGLVDKADWMIDLAIKKDPKQGLLYYQQGRLHMSQNEQDLASTSFKKTVDLKVNVPEINTMTGISYYNSHQCKNSITELGKTTVRSTQNKSVIVAYGECLAQTGSIDQAVEFADLHMKYQKQNMELILFNAHINEKYKKDFEKTISTYEYALKQNPSEDAKTWIQSKLKNLKTRKQVTQISATQGGH